ncbi:MAG: sensor histidine kinase [Spirochaetales bacterium]
MAGVPRRSLCRIGLSILFCITSFAVSATDPVTLQLRWAPQFQFAGYYAALWQGYYEEAGLDVQIRSALQDGRILRATDVVAAREAEFGIGAADILFEHTTGAELTIVASIFQESAAALYALEGTELSSPDDLLSLTFAVIPDDLIEFEVQAMLLHEGLDPDAGATVPLRPGISQLLEGQADVLAGYRTSAPWIFQTQGLDYVELRPSAHGVGFYGDSLFTRAELARSDPDLVARFRDASLRGWKYAFDNVEEIIARISTVERVGDPVDDPEGLNRWQAEATRRLARYPEVELGHMNRQRWLQMHETLTRLGAIDGPLDTDALIFDPDRALTVRRERIALASSIAVAVLLLFAAGTMTWTLTLQKKVQERTDDLQAAVAERDRLFAEMNHRVKNNLAMVSGLLQLKEHDTGDAVDLSDVRTQIAAIGKVHDQLSRVAGSADVAAREYLQNVVSAVVETTCEVPPETAFAVDDIQLSAKRAVVIGLIVNELVINAVKHGFDPSIEPPRLNVGFEESARHQILTVRNNGRAFPPGLNLETANSLGLKLVTQLVAQMHGSIQLTREPITTFEISLPLEGNQDQ